MYWMFDRNYNDLGQVKSKGMFLAKALYDNIAETPDELAFRRGDVLTVVEQDASGLEGWWLCSLRGKHGIAPGNRLKILSGMADPAKTGMEVPDQQGAGAQDYDVPSSNLPLPGISSSRRASNDSLGGRADTSGAYAGRPGSRKASLATSDVYDTPPTSKWASMDSCASGGIYDTPPSSKRGSSERTPPTSNRSSAASRDSRDSNFIGRGSALGGFSPSPSLQQLSVPASLLQHRRRSGGSAQSSGDNCYDTPPGSNRSSLERILSEEGPPIYESLSPSGSNENLASTEDPTYDTPPNRGHMPIPPPPLHSLPARQAHPRGSHSQTSLHSAQSTESLLSNTSGISSARLSHTASFSDSARSSMDLPADTYDVPPSAQHDKQLSTDSGLGFYDSPVKSRPSSSTSGNSIGGTISQNGTLKSSQSSFNCRPSPSPSGVNKDFKRSRSLENALDDLYDTPRNNAPKVTLKKLGSNGGSSSSFGSSSVLNEQSGVYDIPPQVTRDSVISARSDSSNEENQRLSSSSLECDRTGLENPIWDVLPLDLDSALELLVKRQQDVSKATSRLASYITEDWRSRSSLEKKLYDIKVACSMVRTSLYEFVQFSLKAVSNAASLPDKHLAGRLQKQVSPLQSTLEFVNKSFNNLEEAKWQVALLCEPYPKNKPDDLGQIALVARDLLPEVKRLASYIQSNSSTLFKKSSDYKSLPTSLSSKPPIAPGSSLVGSGSKQRAMQHRPLPAVPPSEVTPTKQFLMAGKTPELSSATSNLSLYDIKAALHQDDYVECDELPDLPSPGPGDYVPAQKDLLLQQISQEYDYVELDSKDDIDPGDAGTLKANSSRGQCVVKNKDTEDVSSLIDGCDCDTIPVRDIQPGEDKTPTAKTSGTELPEVCNDIGGGSPSSPSDADLKTPVNTVESDNTYEDKQTQQAFVLPPPNHVSQASDNTAAHLNEEINDSEDDEGVLDPNDRQVLVYYADQMSSHATLLANSTDAFLGVVSGGQPPNVFISHSKFLIVSAHKLVHIGDSIHRSLASNSISAKIMRCANNLCDCLKASVTATKTAALQYPSGPAKDEMVDRVMAVSHAAHELRLVITQAIK